MLALPESLRRPTDYRRAARERPLLERDRRMPAAPDGRSSGARSYCRRSRGGQGVTHLGVTRLAALRRATGELHGAICLFTDLTAVKELEEQLRLKDSLATVGELTAGIAHEFRNGLATIHGYSKLLDLQALPEAYRPVRRGIRAETESLGQVVTNFLNFARPAQLTLSRRRSARDLRAGRGRSPRRRARARRRRRRCAASSASSTATRCCCARRSATCCGTRSRRAPARPAPPHIVIRVGPSIARSEAVAHRRQRQRPGHRAGARASGCSGRSSPRSATAPGSASRSCRRSSCFTTAGSCVGTSPGGGASLQITLPTTG